jgi:hypothetical protein
MEGPDEEDRREDLEEKSGRGCGWRTDKTVCLLRCIGRVVAASA